MNTERILTLTEKYKERVIELRREFHRFPEPSREEKQSQARIIKELNRIGITEIRTYYNTGLAAVIRGGHPGKTIGIRADMDALYVEEATGLPFSSENPGVSHACGHDGHMAMLLGAAMVLYEMRDELYGNVKLIFQP
ncbi:MAG: M20/M25/M40 family metallo-hydrolase, partial [Clostridia bacterium]|nr:M20/M25/M40 family metallo-hydrolase [Clostridia bacterium]